MPYIDKRIRDFATEPEDVGELNFAITKLCVEYMMRKGKKYATINDIVGVLECAKQEFYRRVAAPYEDLKCEENGDVYPSDAEV